MEIETPRLLLRQWRDGDVETLAAIYADDAVADWGVGTPERAAAHVESFMNRWGSDGFSLWVAELKATGEMVGRIGITRQTDWVEPGSNVEVGWTLARAHWGKGLASEGGRASLRFGFEQQGLDEIISITRPDNVRSRAVMERLGLTYKGATHWRGFDQVWYSIARESSSE